MKRTSLCLLCLVLFSGCDAGRVISPDAAPLPAVGRDPLEAGASRQWPGWRGENCSGVSPDSALPVTFGPGQGMRWSAAVAGEGNSSPVVWNDRVWLTTAVGSGTSQKLLLLCYDRGTGKLLWQVEAGVTRGGTHVKNGYASATPVTDGRRVFACFGSTGLIACDLEGNLLWRTDLGSLDHQWGTAASPVLFDDLVIQQCDSAANSYIAAFRQDTGKPVWRSERASVGGWSTPVFIDAVSDDGGAPRTEMIVNGTGTNGGPGTVIAYDPRTGDELWQVTGTTDIVCPTVILAGGLAISTSGRNGPFIAIKPGGSGDVADSHVAWKLRRGGPYVPTGVAYRNRLYIVTDGGVLACYNPGNGDQLWQQRLRGAFTASLVAGAGKVYAVSERGTVYVFEAADEYRGLSANEFGERMLATPAISDGELFIRGEKTLYCVAAVKAAAPAASDRAATGDAGAASAESPPTPHNAEAANDESNAANSAPGNGGDAADASTSHNWPQWGRDPSRNMVARNVENLPARWDMSGGEHIRWSADLGRVSYGNPALADGKIFVGANNEQPRDPALTGDRGVLMCFRADDGAFLWQDSYDKLPTGEAQDWPLQGICSSPAVDGRRVYYLNNRAQVVCADTEGFRDGENDGPVTDESETGPESADIVWRFDLIEELGVSPHNMAASNPLIVGDRLYIVTSNGVAEEENLPAPQAPSFVALDKHTGRLLWQEGSVAGPEHRVRQEKILDGQWGSPAYGEVRTATGVEPQVYFPGGDGWLYALDPATGALLWKFNGNPPEARWLSSGRGDRLYFVATPVFVENRVYIALGQDPANGGGPGNLYAIEATGRGDVTATHVAWRRGGKEFGRSISTVAVDDGLLYAAELDGFLHCIDAATGALCWSHDTLSQVWGSPLVADGKVYLGDEDGDVVVLAAQREKKLLAENPSTDAVYGTPIAVGRTLYLTTRSALAAIELPSESVEP